MKKYNNSNNGKLDNNIDRYDDNENDNYDNNSNKSRFQVKSARFTRFCLYSKHCDWNYEVSVQLLLLFNYLLFLKLLFIPALKKLVLVATYVTPTKLSKVFNGKDM